MTRSPTLSAFDVIQSPTPDKQSYHQQHDDARSSSLSSRLKRWYFGVPGILAGALVGLLLGYGLQRARPSSELVSWVAVPGDLFVRAIKCLVSPLVFCSLIVGMADMLAAGKASQIGWRTALLYAFTTLMATCQGLVWVVIFRPWFGHDAPTQETVKPAAFALACGEPGYFLAHAPNGSVQCVFDAAFNATQQLSATSVFNVTDVHGSFALRAAPFVQRSLSQALQGQLQAIVTSNITQAFADGVLLSIIAFAVPFGVALSLLPHNQQVVMAFRARGQRRAHDHGHVDHPLPRPWRSCRCSRAPSPHRTTCPCSSRTSGSSCSASCSPSSCTRSCFTPCCCACSSRETPSSGCAAWRARCSSRSAARPPWRRCPWSSSAWTPRAS
ncbi:hypothetical protein PINS_up024029 [Pythium insidiosum]|nr:hypothetical protein PINS_up024029 [Pythium insidiosum]